MLVQAAVPNIMQQLRPDPASGNALGTHGSSSAVQNLDVIKTMHRTMNGVHADNY